MRHYPILRLLLVGLLLYVAWPLIPLATSQLEMLFWAFWLFFLVLVIGANLATLLQMTDPPTMEQEKSLERRTHNY